MKKLFLLIYLSLFLAESCALAAVPKKEVKRGNSLFSKGNYKDALKQYEDALVKSPDSDVVNYNLGAALYKTEDYEAAINHFEKSLSTENKVLEKKSSYNIGNAKYKFGITKEESNLEAAVALVEQSLPSYERALELDPKDEDAKYNYEFVKKELERLKEKLKKEEKAQSQKQTGYGENKDSEKKAGEEEEAKDEPGGKEKKKEEKAKDEEKRGEDKNTLEENKQAEDRAGKEEKPSEKESSGEIAGEKKSPEEVSEKEARMLLDNYRDEEEPKRLYKENVPLRQMPEPSKDW